MHTHRLSRLADLTKGIALVGFGISTTLACGDPPHVNSPRPPDPEAPHINSPPNPGPEAAPSAAPSATPAASASSSAATAPSASSVPLNPIHVNAPPKKPPPPPKP